MALALGEETAVQAVVGSVVWAFRRLKKPRYREMSAHSYALYSVCPQLSFFLFSKLFLLRYATINFPHSIVKIHGKQHRLYRISLITDELGADWSVIRGYKSKHRSWCPKSALNFRQFRKFQFRFTRINAHHEESQAVSMIVKIRNIRFPRSSFNSVPQSEIRKRHTVR